MINSKMFIIIFKEPEMGTEKEKCKNAEIQKYKVEIQKWTVEIEILESWKIENKRGIWEIYFYTFIFFQKHPVLEIT